MTGSATKQSSFRSRASGLLRFARNDERRSVMPALVALVAGIHALLDQSAKKKDVDGRDKCIARP
jgi:hypothetical protein